MKIFDQRNVNVNQELTFRYEGYNYWVRGGRGEGHAPVNASY